MLRSSVLLALALSAPNATAPRAGDEAGEMRRARDGNIAIQEELDAAREAATVEAYDLFIARHPDHPLATIAREERRHLLDRRDERRT